MDNIMKNIIVYSKKDCVGCMLTKNFLTQKGIAFEDRSITDNEINLLAVENLGYKTVPIVVFPDQSSWAFAGQPSLIQLEKLIQEKMS
jgi:glutaredoxin-like protein NrdH